MIYRTYLGLDLQPQAIRAVSLRRQGKSVSLTGGRLLGLDEGVLRPMFRTINIGDSSRFIDSVREVLDPLSGQEDRISLAVPETAGLVLIAEIDTPIASRSEGVDILKWQLREKLPPDVNMQIDYQVLSRDEAGRQKVLVSGMSVEVLAQYEDVIAEAGYGAELIGFRSMGLFNYYRARLNTGENFMLIQVEDGSLSFQYHTGGALSFLRSRDVGSSVENVYREISRSLAGERARLSGVHRAPVYLHSNWDDKEELRQALTGLFANEPVLLNPMIEKLSGQSLALSEKNSCSLVTAIGAAERLIWS